MKAQQVAGLEPTQGLAQVAKRIVAVRVAELYSFAPAALEPDGDVALHDMRIAAKRLRYVLELVGFCLDGVAVELAGRARELQTLIGEIHDYDVLLARLARVSSANSTGSDRLARRFREQREALFVQFTTQWAAIEASGLHDRLLAATNTSPNGVPISA
jgi:CHAD domain-containing protein